ncbi:hypothetical protein SDC9_196877 [bioreactor metagenome]|uniref:Uncharacterized protein n=1 Tax=bioreactor metagenome TaxID=1076179 RepID=A0A645IEJ4_9ZZZZ
MQSVAFGSAGHLILAPFAAPSNQVVFAESGAILILKCFNGIMVPEIARVFAGIRLIIGIITESTAAILVLFGIACTPVTPQDILKIIGRRVL